MNAVASESASPIQPVFHSHSFLLQMSDFAVPRLAVGPGTKMMDTTKTMAAGIMRAMRTKSHVGIVSCSSNGYDMSRLTGENGRLKGVRNSQPAPRAAIPLHNCQLRIALQGTLALLPAGRAENTLRLTYMMQIQSKTYDSISRTDGRLNPLKVGMTARFAVQL